MGVKIPLVPFPILLLALSYFVAAAVTIDLSIIVDGESRVVIVPLEAPPLASARKLCNEYRLKSHIDDSCSTLLSGEIHRLQYIEMGRTSPLHSFQNDTSTLASYADKVASMGSILASRGYAVVEGHVGMVASKAKFLSRLGSSPLFNNIFQIGMVKYLFFLLLFFVLLNTLVSRTPVILPFYFLKRIQKLPSCLSIRFSIPTLQLQLKSFRNGTQAATG
jgi:hypothetical protein